MIFIMECIIKKNVWLFTFSTNVSFGFDFLLIYLLKAFFVSLHVAININERSTEGESYIKVDW